jgi:hypothetical protein
MTVRIYVPLTLARLVEAVDSGEVGTDAERFVAADQSEESEYLALMSAADASTEQGAARRVVLVAQVPDEDAAAPRSSWIAVHADVDQNHGVDDEPAWFGIQELPALLA